MAEKTEPKVEYTADGRVKKPGVKYVTIVIPEEPTEDGLEAFYCGVNGENYLIPRGVPYEVPDYIKAQVDDIQKSKMDALKRQRKEQEEFQKRGREFRG